MEWRERSNTPKENWIPFIPCDQEDPRLGCIGWDNAEDFR